MNSQVNTTLYPLSMRYLSNRLVGFSTNVVRVEPQSSATNIRAGRKIVATFPENALIDLRSIAMVIDKVSTTGNYAKDASDNVVGTFGVLPWASGLVESVSIYGNSILLNNVLTEFNTAARMKDVVADNVDRNMTAGSVEGSHITQALSGSFATAETDTFGESKAMVLRNIMGLPSESSTRYWDSSVAGALRIEVLLAQNECLGLCNQMQHTLAGGTAHAGTLQHDLQKQPGNVNQHPANEFGVALNPSPAYTVEDFHFSCSVVSVEDGTFSAMVRTQIEDQGFVQINYKDYYSLLNSQTAGGSQIVRFAASSQSINSIMATFRNPNYNTFPTAGEKNCFRKAQPTMLYAPQLGTTPDVGSEYWSNRNYSYDQFVPRWFAFQSFNAGNVPFGTSAIETGTTWRSDGTPNGTMLTQFSVNNITYPQTLVGQNESQHLQTLFGGKSQRHEDGALCSTWVNNQEGDYVNVCNLALCPDDDNPLRVCATIAGFDSRAVNTSMTFRSQGQTDDAKVAYVLVECTSSVRIGQGRSLARIA